MPEGTGTGTGAGDCTGGAIHPDDERCGIGGRTCSVPVAPQRWHRTVSGNRMEPLPWRTSTARSSTRQRSQ
jgi:hypothetical protein